MLSLLLKILIFKFGCILCRQVAKSRFDSVGGVLAMLAAYCSIVVNPVIYIAQYEVVRRPLANCVKCITNAPPTAN